MATAKPNEAILSVNLEWTTKPGTVGVNANMPNIDNKPEPDAAALTGKDRRQSRRFALQGARGTLSWVEDGRVTRCAAVISDISEGGLKVRTSRVPRGVDEVRLELDSQSSIVPAWTLELVGSPQAHSGQFSVPLKFKHGVHLEAVLDQYHAGRMWKRYATKALPVNLTWYDASGEVSIVGEITNISGGGAALLLRTECTPPVNQEIYLELRDTASGVEPVEARVIAVSVKEPGVTITRLWFIGPCPIELFELAREHSDEQS